MFGSFIQYHFDVATKKLTITQRPRADNETILMHTDNFRPDIHCSRTSILNHGSRDYTLAVSKASCWEKQEASSTPCREPQGGTTLKR